MCEILCVKYEADYRLGRSTARHYETPTRQLLGSARRPSIRSRNVGDGSAGGATQKDGRDCRGSPD